PAIEAKAAGRIALVHEGHGVAGDEIAFLVERLAGELGGAPVAGRDVRATHADFQLVAIRYELDLLAGQRRTNVSDLRVVPVEDKRARRRLGKTPAADHAWRVVWPLALRKFGKPVPEMLWKRRGGVEHSVEIGKETLAQGRVLGEHRQQQLKAFRHV